MRALDLFRDGHNTQSIANILGIEESEAYNMLAAQRELERYVPSREKVRQVSLHYIATHGGAVFHEVQR